MYDAGSLTGKYISDFSDPDLMGHPRHLVLPHLGASTGEAEENSAAMAAETIKSFLETGSIRHSVNFPSVSLPYATDAGAEARLCIVNDNKPGVLGAITTFLGSQNINIVQQINSSRGDIAYTVSTRDHGRSVAALAVATGLNALSTDGPALFFCSVAHSEGNRVEGPQGPLLDQSAHTQQPSLALNDMPRSRRRAGARSRAPVAGLGLGLGLGLAYPNPNPNPAEAHWRF